LNRPISFLQVKDGMHVMVRNLYGWRGLCGWDEEKCGKRKYSPNRARPNLKQWCGCFRHQSERGKLHEAENTSRN
jgi:hypothetical protein